MLPFIGWPSPSPINILTVQCFKHFMIFLFLKKTVTFIVYVVVNFLSQVIFVFLLFLGMVMCANEVETKEKEKLPEIKKIATTYTCKHYQPETDYVQTEILVC